MSKSIYTHKHHIIPRHAGGTDDPSNITELTIEEHALAHKKLYEEHGRWQDEVAYLTLSGQIGKEEAQIRAIREGAKKRRGNCYWSEEQKENLSKSRKGTGNPMYGKKLSKETRQKMSEVKKGRTPNNKGKKWTEEQKEKVKGRIPWNKGKKGVQVAWNKGKRHTEETRKKIRNAVKTQKRDENGRYIKK